MRKIKTISIMITVFAIIFGVGFKVYSSCNKDKQIIVENGIIAENEKAEIEKNEETPVIVEIPIEESIEESNTKNDDIVPKIESSIEKQENKPISSSKTKANENTENKQDIQSSQTGKNVKQYSSVTTSNESRTEQKQEIASKVEVQEKEPEKEIKQEEKAQTKSNWCFEGGSNHIAGDGANEHGYYNTWEEAFNAYEEYTKNWLSSHYKVNQCACGKYYFWAIQD